MMTRFEQSLAAFEQYIKASEPQISGQVSDIIDRYYRAKTNFAGAGLGDAGYMPGFPIGDAASSDPAAASAAVDTSNVLGDFINGVTNGLVYAATTKDRLATLQAAAQVEQARAIGSASTNTTTLLVVGAIALLAVLALKRK